MITSSPRKPAHSPKLLLDVMTIDAFSCRVLTKVKNKLASAFVTGKKPTSSITIRCGDSIKIGQVKLSLTSVEGIIKQMTKGDQFNGKQESKAVQ